MTETWVWSNWSYSTFVTRNSVTINFSRSLRFFKFYLRNFTSVTDYFEFWTYILNMIWIFISTYHIYHIIWRTIYNINMINIIWNILWTFIWTIFDWSFCRGYIRTCIRMHTYINEYKQLTNILNEVCVSVLKRAVLFEPFNMLNCSRRL